MTRLDVDVSGESKPLTLERIQKLAEEIRQAYDDLLGGSTVAAPALIRELVREWSSQVLPAIDSRITRCHELVRRGLRDEAVEYALEPPNLYEAVSALDLERFGKTTCQAWMSAGEVAGLPFPPRPKVSEMGDIYAARDWRDEQKPLLDRWRRLNIERASLRQRINLLRRIAAIDSRAAVWREMLEEHEAFRLMEIKAALARMREQFSRDRSLSSEAVKQAAARLELELQGEWDTVTPPEELLEQVQQLGGEAEQRRVDATLDQIVLDLEAAYAELNGDRAAAKQQLFQIIDAWDAALAERGVIDPADPRLARVDAVLTYARMARDLDNHIMEVGHRVGNRPADLRSRVVWSSELDRMMDLIDDVASRLPAADVDIQQVSALSDRVAGIAEDVQRETGARRVVLGVGGGAILVGIAAAMWVVFAVRQHREDIAVALAACEEAVIAIEAGRDKSAEELSAEWAEPVRRDSQVVAALGRVESARAAWAADRESFAKHIEDLRQVLVDLEAAPRPDPFTQWPDSFVKASNLLSEIRDRNLAGTEEERARLIQPEATLQTKGKDYAAAAGDAFEARVRRLEADLRGVTIAVAADVARAHAKIEDAEAKLADLRSLAMKPACPGATGFTGTKLIPETAASSVSANSVIMKVMNDLRSRCEVVEGLAQRESQADRLLMDGKFAEYAAAIAQIADDLGGGIIARDYKDVAREHAEWKAYADWRTFVEALVEPRHLTSDTAKTLLEKLRGLRPDVLRLPAASSATKWLEPVLKQAAANTTDSLTALEATFVKILDSQFGAEVDGVIWEAGTSQYPRYYCLLRDRPLATQKKQIKYVSGLPDAQKNWPQKNLFFDGDYKVADSPQKILALAGKLALDTTLDREATTVDHLAVSVVHACSRPENPAAGGVSIDACLHALLLRFLVASACDASSVMKVSLVESLTAMDAGAAPDGQKLLLRGVDNEAFTASLDPTRQDDGAWIHTNRAKCKEFVEVVAREVVEAAQTIEAREKEIAGRYQDLRHYVCVGRLRRSSAGGWAISGGSADVRANNRLFVPGGPQNNHTMVDIGNGTLDGGIPPGASLSARAGDPVYIEVAIGKKG